TQSGLSGFSFTAIVVYAKVGDSVVLHPGRSFDNITSISWGHEMSPVLEWFGQDIIPSKCRSDVAKTTGSLIIHNLTVKDTGGYTPQINTLTLNPVVLKVIEPVPKPMVFLKCNVRRTLCDLTCKANTSSQFGPVTYKWEAGNKVVSTDNQLSLTEKDLSRAYTCKVKNPVSTSTSDEVAAPADKGELQILNIKTEPKHIVANSLFSLFLTDVVPIINSVIPGFHPAAVAVPVVLVVLVLVVVGGYVKHRKGENYYIVSCYISSHFWTKTRKSYPSYCKKGLCLFWWVHTFTFHV
uniref:Ig-like domain-containing protein n=1 Tax=Xiphophorus couchianus TaxID=32473 RepID=A0A3B5MAK9_9TELE